MSDKLINFFKSQNEIFKNNDNIILLRPKQILSNEDYHSQDFDYLVNENHLNAVMNSLTRNASNSGINLRIKQVIGFNKILVYLFDDEFNKNIILEFWINIEMSFNNRKFIISSTLIFDKLRKNINLDDLRCLLYITHLFYKNKNIKSEENRFRYNYFVSTTTDEIKSFLIELFNDKININNANSIALNKLNELDIFPKQVSITFLFLDMFKRKINRLCRYRKIIPVLGPDGAGKGAIQNVFIQNENIHLFTFKMLFRLKFIYRLRLSLFNNWRKFHNNYLDERIPYYIFFISFVSLYVYDKLKKRNLTILDRYFIDYLALPLRYSNKHNVTKHLFLYGFLLKLAPSTEKMIFINCSKNTLFSRKKELSSNAVDFLNSVYIDFILTRKVQDILWISSENEIEQSQNTLKQFVYEKSN